VATTHSPQPLTTAVNRFFFHR